jgi:NAD(P)-dependent dehydrogenase (short-subunit alcohol dehydrogenase family)
MSHILITGASSGIGAAAAVELTRAGHAVLVTGRSETKLIHVRNRMIAAAPRDIVVPEPIPADLSSLRETSWLAERVLDRFPRLDVLVNNAAVQPRRRLLSRDAHELGLAVNHLAPFMLSQLLTERLKANCGRVITTSSSTHKKGKLDLNDIQMEKGWSWPLSYARSKLANILFTRELRIRTGLPATSFHPGSICTELNREAPTFRLLKPLERLVLASPEKGADTLVWLATQREGFQPSSYYYEHRRPATTSAAAQDTELAVRLWEITSSLVSAV